MSVESWDFFFIHFCVRQSSHFPQGHLGITEECTNLEFSDSVLVFVRGVIWYQEAGILLLNYLTNEYLYN